MGRTRKSDDSSQKPYRSRARTQEAREKELISLAEQVAEKQMRDELEGVGRASPTIVSSYLKLGTEKAKLERRQLEADVELKKAKVEAIESSQRIEELYNNAMKAMRIYQGEVDDEDVYGVD